MAKRFGGFTPEQMGKIVPEMQGMQADEQARFLASQPGAAARVGKMSELAEKRINMAYGGYVKGYAAGGMANQLIKSKQVNKFNLAEAAKAGTFNENRIKPVGKPSNGMAPVPQPGRPLVSQPMRPKGQQVPVQRPTPGMQPMTPRVQRPLKTNETNPYSDKANQAMRKQELALQKKMGFDPSTIKSQADADANKDKFAQYKKAMTDFSNSNPDVVAAKSYQMKGSQQSAETTQQTPPTDLDTAQQSYADAETALQAARDAQAANPEDTALQDALTSAEANVNLAQEGMASAEAAFKATEVPTSSELVSGAINDPSSMITETDVELNEVTDEQLIDPATGQLKDAAPTVAGTTAETAADVQAPDDLTAETVDTTLSTPAVSEALDGLEAAQGTVSDDATVDAANMSPQELAQLGLEADQIEEAQTVDAPDPRTLQEGELVSGSAVDMERVKKEINFQAATGAPSTDATVQGQLTGLMEQFEGKDPPAWAAGAMRAAGAAMAARGLSASSMAGQAVVQAAMESALPIAMQDAQTSAAFEKQNLSNKQQAAMFAAEKRAEFMGLEFTQEFETRVANASKISDIANMNFTAEQQVALENARMAQSVDLANLGAKNAKVLADAAAMSQMDLANLSNEQQARVTNAKAFLDMDMANLANEQQTSIFKTKAMTDAILSDTAADNATKQFNASSKMQTEQFMANLTSTVSMFNNEQTNAMSKFNAGESNAIEKFNSELINQREQFNTNNSLVIEQANASWYQAVSTQNTAAINDANRADAQAANNMTNLAFNAAMQETRDMMQYAWTSEENDANRAVQIAIAKLSSNDAKAAAAANKTAGMWGAFGSFAAAIWR